MNISIYLSLQIKSKMQTFAFVNIGTGYILIFTKENNVCIYLDQGTEIKDRTLKFGRNGLLLNCVEYRLYISNRHLIYRVLKQLLQTDLLSIELQ